MTAATYPADPVGRTRWILSRRGERNVVDSVRPYAFFTETERRANGELQQTATIFLTNRECPWKCVMCDLWRNTTTAPVPPGAIPRQIEYALEHLPRAQVLKLYNSGSFFDAGAIPAADWKEIASVCSTFEHVIVECHPRLVSRCVAEFASLLQGSFEVALGLETAHPKALEQLNKRITVFDFQSAAARLRSYQIAVRTFLLIHPPFISKAEQELWLDESIRTAFNAGSDVISLIPTRRGNGALEELGVAEPTLSEIEEAQEAGLHCRGGRVFTDTWDLQRFARCTVCARARAGRIGRMNWSQQVEPRVPCPACGP